MLKIVIRSVVLLVVLLWLGKTIPVKAETKACGGSPLLITEVQTAASSASGTANFRYEFAEIYNCLSTSLDLNGYSLSFKNAEGQQIIAVALEGILEPKSFLAVVHNSYKTSVSVDTFRPSVVFAATNGNLNALAADGGSVVLSGLNDTVLDTVTYGTETTMAVAPPVGRSIKRCVDENSFTQTHNNAKDFMLTALPTLSALFKLGPSCTTVPTEPEPEPGCQGLSISEILPNPAGSDDGKEFIELYNPTATAVSLQGCGLRLGETGKTFQLPNETLPAGAYRVFSDTQSGIVLPNKTAETVWLLSSADEQGVKYADNLADDQAWAFIGIAWETTYKLTPLAANVLMKELPGKGALEEEQCADDQERNPATNRCRKKEALMVQSCRPGQERNPDTNRCRVAVTNSSAMVSCQPGQERNPATNRCRRVAAAGEGLKPCAEGQERSAETNRCRKVVAAHDPGLEKVQEVRGSGGGSDPRWWLAGAAAVGMAGYGLYEWRHDIAQRFGKLKQKMGGKNK